MSTIRTGRPPVVQATLADLLRERPRTVSEMALAVYGEDGAHERAAVGLAIHRLRAAGITVTRTCLFSLDAEGES